MLCSHASSLVQASIAHIQASASHHGRVGCCLFLVSPSWTSVCAGQHSTAGGPSQGYSPSCVDLTLDRTDGQTSPTCIYIVTVLNVLTRLVVCVTRGVRGGHGVNRGGMARAGGSLRAILAQLKICQIGSCRLQGAFLMAPKVCTASCFRLYPSQFELGCSPLNQLPGAAGIQSWEHGTETGLCQERDREAGQCRDHGQQTGQSWERGPEAGQCREHGEEAGRSWEPCAEARQGCEHSTKARQARAKSERCRSGGPRRGRSA